MYMLLGWILDVVFAARSVFMGLRVGYAKFGLRAPCLIYRFFVRWFAYTVNWMIVVFRMKVNFNWGLLHLALT